MENFVYENKEGIRKYNPKTPCSSETYVKDKAFIKIREFNSENRENILPFLREVYNLLFLKELKSLLLDENYNNFRTLYGLIDSPTLYQIKIEEEGKKLKVSLEEEFIAGGEDNNLRLYFENKLAKRNYDKFLEELEKISKNISVLMAFKEKIEYLHADFYLRHLIKKRKNKKENKLYLIDHELAIPLLLYLKDNGKEEFVKGLVKKEHQKLINQEWWYLNNYLEKLKIEENEKRRIKQKIKNIMKKAEKQGEEVVNDLFSPIIGKINEIICTSHEKVLKDLKEKNIVFKGYEIKGKRPLMLFKIEH